MASGGITRTALDEPDVVLLDLGLPDIDGVDVCSRIRQWTDVPVIVLSAAGSEQRKVSAFDGGADDYVTKPFGMAELEARIRAALRHSAKTDSKSEQTELDVGPIHVDLVHHEARVDGKLVGLTQQGVRHTCLPGRARRQALHPKDDPRAGLGRGIRNRVAVPARVRLQTQTQARRGGGRLLRTSPGVGYTLGEPN